MKKQVINSFDGSLNISEDLRISTKTIPEDILSYFRAENIETQNIGNGWIHYTIWNVQINKEYFVFTFSFEKNILKHLRFILDEKIIVSESWDNWSEANELTKRKYFQKWLTEEIGKEKEFSWGSVGAYYDQKGGSSSIGLRYL